MSLLKNELVVKGNEEFNQKIFDFIEGFGAEPKLKQYRKDKMLWVSEVSYNPLEIKKKCKDLKELELPAMKWTLEEKGKLIIEQK